MKALVTGATGFVGSHLVRLLLAEGHTVRALYRSQKKLDILEGLDIEPIQGDLDDVALLREACAGCDWVFHVAAKADYWRSDDKAQMERINVDGTRNVLQASNEANVGRVIFTSSASTIGFRADGLPADETEPFNLSPERFYYAYTKVLAEQVVADAVKAGQDVVTVNPTIIIGPGDLNAISGTFIIETAKTQWLTPISSGGVAVIDVRDVARGHLLSAEQGQAGERYILNTANISHREWFNIITDAMNVGRPLFQTPDFILPIVANAIDLLRRVGISTPIDSNQARLGSSFVYFDNSKAQEQLGFIPQIEMEQSVRETFAWYEAHGYIQETVMTKAIHRLGKWLRRT